MSCCWYLSNNECLLTRDSGGNFKKYTRKVRVNIICFKQVISMITIFSLFISTFAVFTTIFIDTAYASTRSIKFTGDNVQTQQQQQQQQPVKQLDCQPGEQRHFNYESATKIWGASNQMIRLRGTLRLRCLEPTNNNTLKYLAEVLSLSPSFGDNEKKTASQIGKKLGLENNKLLLLQRSDSLLSPIQSSIRKADLELARAEPVFEEVGEAISETATRVKRSVSGWFNKTWSSVKDFFVNIFNSNEKSTVSRDQAFKESGIDIASQCKSKSKSGLPIDDSVFDDFEPKYYIGASTDSLSGTAYEFDDRTDHVNGFNDESEDDSGVSFFDDPKPKLPSNTNTRAKRAISSSRTSKSKSSPGKTFQVENNEKLLRLPFVFIQSRVGKILEVRFSNEDVDSSIKNFKRHLCDLFATNLDKSKSQLSEITPIGQHTTKYLIDSSANSNAIKQSLLKLGSSSNENNNVDEQANNKQLVKVLAMVAAATSSESAIGWSTNSNSVEGREPSSTGNSSQGDSLSVLRSINSTTTIQLNSRTIAPDIEQMEVRVKQVQHISDGRMTGSAGQLGMSLIQSGSQQSTSNNPTVTNKRIRFERSLFEHADYNDKKDEDKKNNPKNQEKDTHNSDYEDNHLSDIADLLRISTSFSVQLVPFSKLGNFEALEKSLKDSKVNDLLSSSSSTSSSEAKVRVKRQNSGNESDEVEENSKKSDKEKSLQTIVDNKSLNTSSNKDRQVVVGDKNLNGSSNSSSSSSNTFMTHQMKSSSTNTNATNTITKPTRVKREPLVTRPSDSQELQSVMKEWHQLELKLKLVPTTLLPESSFQDGQIERLEILRNQIQMRLNEEFMRNRLRRVSKQQLIQAAASTSSSSRVSSSSSDKGEQRRKQQQQQQDGAKLPSFKQDGNDLGLGLTQIILDNGITSKTKGSIYSTIEEVLDLESSLDEDSQDNSVSKLLRDTVRMDKLKIHCKSAILTLDDIRSSTSRLELRMPFNVKSDSDEESSQGNERLSKVVANLSKRNQRKLDQCKQVAQLLLRVNDRKAADLVIDLIDECNNRLLLSSRDEELGYGPISRYYRNLRQQFTELLTNLNRPSDSMIDKLLSRVNLLRDSSSTTAQRRKLQSVESQQEFTYVTKTSTNGGGEDIFGGQKYNKSLLREEDDFNNNDGVGSLVMTITSLGAKPSISNSKRIEIVEKLLGMLKNSTCSLFNGPDLDILESMSNFQEPMDEIVGKVVHLARRCKNQDQYLVACIHGLQGQLKHSLTQRFLVEQLRSINVSCTVKSEIVLVLIGAILVEDLKSLKSNLNIINNDHYNTPLVDDGGGGKWPSIGTNQVDDVLMEIIDENQNNKRYLQDKKCLKQLVVYYMSKKEQISGKNVDKNSSKQQRKSSSATTTSSSRNGKRTTHARYKRAVINDNSFWDDAQCKRWALPDPSSTSSPDNNTLYNFPFTSLRGNEEIDDNSILVALANNKPISSSSSSRRGNGARNLQLLERESDSSPSSSSSPSSPTFVSNNKNTNNTSADNLQTIRKRHKCSASKTYGPKNAQATLKAEVVNDLIGAQDENKFLARFRLTTNFLGNSIDVGRMYLWHQKRTTRAHVNILGKSLWDTSHSCQDKAPNNLLYMPLFDFNLWLVKVSVGLKLQSEMGFFSNCDQRKQLIGSTSRALFAATNNAATAADATDQIKPELNEANVAAKDQLELFPTISLRASGEASAKFVVARAGMSVASQYGYQGSIRVSRQPESCMSIYSAHQPMNITFSSWFQLWDNDCHYWGSRNKAEPQATKWRLSARKPIAWLEDECLLKHNNTSSG